MNEELINYLNDSIVTDKMTDENADKDRCKYTWDNFYKKVYQKNDHWRENSFECNKGIIMDGTIKISGDTLFNFKCGNIKNKKYEVYKEYLNSSDLSNDDKSNYLRLLDFCNEVNYSFYNFGFMPVTGDFQAVKNNCMDRLDRFIWKLDGYFNLKKDEDKFNHKIFEHVTRNPRGPKKKLENEEDRQERGDKQRCATIKKMISYLDSFGSIYKFCNAMYLTDEDMVNRLKESGRYEINKGEDVISYMKTAISFWIYRDKKYGNRELQKLLKKEYNTCLDR